MVGKKDTCPFCLEKVRNGPSSDERTVVYKKLHKREGTWCWNDCKESVPSVERDHRLCTTAGRF
jgi:hypothetical protein